MLLRILERASVISAANRCTTHFRGTRRTLQDGISWDKMSLVSLILFLGCILGLSFADEGPMLEEPLIDAYEEDNIEFINRLPDNIILFLASGMSVEAVGKTKVEISKEMQFDSFDPLPLGYLSRHGKLKTYAADFTPGNLESGLKNIFYGSRESKSCGETIKEPRNILSLARKAGKYTGIITNLDVLSQVPPAFFGHEDCFNPSKSNLSAPLCLLENSKVNVMFGKHQDEDNITPEDQASYKHCSLIDEETFVKKWHQKGFRKILFNSSDVNNKNLTADGNVLGLFPTILKDDFITLISRTIELFKSNQKGYFLVVYLKYPDVLETVDLASRLFPLTSRIVADYTNPDTLVILTSEYACEGVCLKKTTGNRNLPKQKELKKKDEEVSKLKENPDDFEETVKNAAERVNRKMQVQEEENSDVHQQQPMIQESRSKESHKLITTDKVSLENPRSATVLPKTVTIQTKQPEKAMEEVKVEQPPISAVDDAVSVEKEQEEENSEVHQEHPVIQESRSKESHKLMTTDKVSLENPRSPPVLPKIVPIQTKQPDKVIGEVRMEQPPISAVSVGKRQKINNISKEEEKNTFGESKVTLGNTTAPTNLPITSPIQTMQPEKIAGGRVEHPQTSIANDAEYASTPLINHATPSPDLMNQTQTEGAKAVVFEIEDELKSTSYPLNDLSDSKSTSNHVENLENKTSNELSTRRKRESKPKISPDVPIYTAGPMEGLFKGVLKQQYLWIFMKMSLCADNRFASSGSCTEDKVMNKHFEALFLNKSLKGRFEESGAPGILVNSTSLWVYLTLAWFFFYKFYF